MKCSPARWRVQLVDWPAGFTLLEMIVVLVILGLTLSVVAGSFSRRNTTLESRAATARIVNVLRLARARAMAEDRSIVITGVPDGHELLLNGDVLGLGPSVTVTLDRPGVSFEPDGSSSGASLNVLTDQRRSVVTVNWLTGRVSAVELK
jgi:general secretion pathway protein H